MRTGLIGCGNISGAYLKNARTFSHLTITKCADLRPEAAQARAQEFGLEAVSVEALLADPELDAVLNLTTPLSHTDIDLRALEAGKHIYSEKPFGVDFEAGRKVLAEAKKRGLRVGCAPDTFLGGGHQTCRALIDEGRIGNVIGGTAFMLCHGHEAWHPAPAFYYQFGGGPLFDMGPYYITALVNMLGPVKSVMAANTRSTDLRQGLRVNAGKTFPVEVDTHISAVLEFANGAVITLITSFDVWATNHAQCIELYGTEGALLVPDPNSFNGDIKFFRNGMTAEWAKADNPRIYNENMRCIGLADMAAGIDLKRPHRCSGELACHVLDVMCSIIRSGKEHAPVCLETTCERPAALPQVLVKGELD